MNNTFTHKIRPSSRILRTIGKDLIKDIHAAIIELVKNSYDADATTCNVILEYNHHNNNLSIIVSDNGHGMSLDTITNVWLVPATSNKKDKELSPNGRAFQGRKGIGRYAVGILGDSMIMDSIDNQLNKSSILLDFDKIEESQYLEDVDVLIETSKGTNSGVKIEAISEITIEELLYIWNNKQLEKLKLELQKLQSPIVKDNMDIFEIYLEFKDFPICIKNCHKEFEKREIENKSSKEKIEALPIIDYYDYRIHGKINNIGEATLFYENKNLNLKPLEIKTKISLKEDETFCGLIEIDFRVFDRDPEAIADLLERGLKDYHVGKLEARKLLDSIYGVGIYRGGFRIRPYGDVDYDWLDLDKKRIQNPSKQIGMNQIVGFVSIEKEEQSNLFEKSARDGLSENSSYRGLIRLCNDVLIEHLQPRRFIFRQKTNRGRKTVNIEDKLNSLFNFEKLENKVSTKLTKVGVDTNVVKTIDNYIKEEKKSKEKDLKDIKHTIAIYQGQVTLGKLTDVMLHEGRRSLKYINEQSPRINRWIKKFTAEPNDIELKDKIEDRSNSIVYHSKALSNLFKKIEPLSRSRLPSKTITNLFTSINKSVEIFETTIESEEIQFINNIDQNLEIFGREFDIITAFSNFIDNSIYWLVNSIDLDDKEKIIKINSEEDENSILIEFSDNGPGINDEYAEHIFDPGFTLKENGTGLGLSLAAEALKRSGGKISVIKAKTGTILHIEFTKGT